MDTLNGQFYPQELTRQSPARLCTVADRTRRNCGTTVDGGLYGSLVSLRGSSATARPLCRDRLARRRLAGLDPVLSGLYGVVRRPQRVYARLRLVGGPRRYQPRIQRLLAEPAPDRARRSHRGDACLVDVAGTQRTRAASKSGL